MKILIAMDSFKGSLSSLQAGSAVREGILSVDPRTEICLCPLADGGEGTVDALCSRESGRIVDLVVTGPLGDPVKGRYGILDGNTAVIEIAAAAGLPFIPENQRDPRFTTTYGVGEMICDAVSKGCRDFIIGLGGSGTNDGGIGMLQALGWKFTDAEGHSVPYGAVGLREVQKIDPQGVHPALDKCRFRVACDVSNPLLGEFGCSAVFAPQKGADALSVKEMDRWMENYSRLVQQHYPTADPDKPGAGAAGGLGFAFSVFLRGEMESGAKIVGEVLGIEEKISCSDLVFTGEGCLDSQSSMGKGPMYIAGLGKKYGKTVVALAGTIGSGAEASLQEGVSAYFPILRRPMSLQEAMDAPIAYDNLRNMSKQIMNLYLR